MFQTLPDPEELRSDQLLEWITSQIALLKITNFTKEILETCQVAELKNVESHPFGPEGNATWRKFFLATLLADWSCYDKIADRFDYARLKYVMTSAFPYVRVWFCKLPSGISLPVGYTSWYPIARYVFEGLQNNPHLINDRGMFLPLRSLSHEEIAYVYAVNISIFEKLRNTPVSFRMLRSYQKEARNLRHAGIAAITVAEDGSNLSKIYSLHHIADITIGGEKGSLYMRPPRPHPHERQEPFELMVDRSRA